MAIVDRARDVALQKGLYSKEELNEWYEVVQRTTLRYNYIKKYIQSFDEHAAFEKEFSNRYPLLYKKITKEFKIRLLKLVYNRKYDILWLLKLTRPIYYRKIVKLKGNFA
jgi:hypothetical protein